MNSGEDAGQAKHTLLILIKGPIEQIMMINGSISVHRGNSDEDRQEGEKLVWEAQTKRSAEM